MGALLSDFRYALHGFGRAWPAVLTIIGCLGFGTGSVTLVYSWYAGLIQQPLPAVPRMTELITVRSQAAHGWTLTSWPEYRDWRDSARSVTGLAASSLHLFGVSVAGGAGAVTEPVYGMFASVNYFGVLGVPVPIGRDFHAAEDDAAPDGLVAIVSDRFWKDTLAGAPDVAGRSIRINGQLARIIGVAAPGFGGTLAGASFDLWVPLAARQTLVPSDAALADSRAYRWIDVTGRRHPASTLQQAQEEFDIIGRRLAATYIESSGRTIQAGPLDTGSMQQLRPLFVSLLGLTAVVLLLVCSNVANILLVRGSMRVREIAVRFALGATRSRIIAQLMLENVMLAVAGAAAGTALAVLGRAALIRMIPATTIPLNLQSPLDRQVLLFVVLLTSATVLMFGLLPALITSRVRITEALAGGTRGTTAAPNRMRAVLVSAQIALCLTTLVTASLFMRRAEELHALDRGFVDPARVLLVQSELGLAGYRDIGRWQAALDTIADRVRELPGVRSATWATFAPLGFVGYARPEVQVEGHTPRPGESMRVLVNGVADGYFDLMGTPILEGRPIVADDAAHRPGVAVVNEAFVRRFWQGASPLGRRITIDRRTLTVVGVARDGRYDYRLIDEAPEPLVYYALRQSPSRFAILHARTGQPAGALAPAIREVITREDPGFATLAPISLEDYTAGPMTPVRIVLLLLGVLGAAALGLSAMGLQAIVAHGVALRRREIGVRLALGASHRQVNAMFLRQTLGMTGAGVLAGLAVTATVVPILRHQLGYLAAPGFATVLPACGLLAIVGVAAGYLSVRRTARIDPIVTLRAE